MHARARAHTRRQSNTNWHGFSPKTAPAKSKTASLCSLPLLPTWWPLAYGISDHGLCRDTGLGLALSPTPRGPSNQHCLQALLSLLGRRTLGEGCGHQPSRSREWLARKEKLYGVKADRVREREMGLTSN